MTLRNAYWKWVLIAAGLMLVFLAVFLPVWEGFDEPAHFCYVQYLVEHQKIPQPPGGNHTDYCSTEVENSLAALPLNNTLRLSPQLFALHYPDYQAYWKTKTDDQPELIPADSTARTTTHAILDIWQAQHPPLPYLILTIPYILTRSLGLYTQVLVLRLACAAITILGLWVCWKSLQKIIVPPAARLVGFAAIGLAPMFFIHFGRISNEPVTFLLFSASWYFLLEVLQSTRLQRRSALGLGVIYGLGFISKVFFLTALPALLIIFLIDFLPHRHTAADRNPRLVSYAYTLGGIAVFAVPWLLYQKFWASSAGIGFSQLGSTGLSGIFFGLLHLSWYVYLREVALNFFGLFGWSFLRAPLWFYVVNILFWYHTFFGFIKLRGMEMKIAASALLFPLSIVAGMAVYNLHFQEVAITGGWYFYSMGAMLATIIALSWNKIFKETGLLKTALLLSWFNIACLVYLILTLLMPTYYAI